MDRRVGRRYPGGPQSAPHPLSAGKLADHPCGSVDGQDAIDSHCGLTNRIKCILSTESFSRCADAAHIYRYRAQAGFERGSPCENLWPYAGRSQSCLGHCRGCQPGTSGGKTQKSQRKRCEANSRPSLQKPAPTSKASWSPCLPVSRPNHWSRPARVARTGRHRWSGATAVALSPTRYGSRWRSDFRG